ncbi:MAG: GspE/PulE family protein [Pseudomonadales bacterium]
MVDAPKKIRLGDLLVQENVISEAQLQHALEEQKRLGLKLGRSLIELNFLSEDQLLQFLSQQLHIPYINIENHRFDEELVRRLPEALARRYRALVLEEQEGELVVGMGDPLDIYAYDEIARVITQPIRLAVVRESDVLAALDRVYRRTDEMETLAEELHDELGEDQFDIGQLTAADDSDAPVVRLLQSIFEDALQVKASDVHIEPDESVVRVRQRVDGVLQEHVMKEKRITAALVLRLKLMSGLDISEKRIPQDGRFSLRVKGHDIDIRLSTLPTLHGESVVMRLLDQSGDSIDLNHSGMPQGMLERFRGIIHRPHGLVLVTGPTGSGKTTTLYGALSELNSPEKKIITVEDPVEYQLERVNQVQINSKIGLDFGKVLRATLRQDPDILLVGEIRDQETAEIALRASMTGHLVLSTLHTNDAITSAMRLLDIGVEGYLAAASLKAVIAQRLVRRICSQCSVDDTPEAQELILLEVMLGAERLAGIQFKKGRGCQNCNHTGYSGRIGVFELLEINESMADALRRNDSSGFSKAAAACPDFKPLNYVALEYAAEGITTIDEVFRVAEQVEENRNDLAELVQETTIDDHS